MSDTDNGIKQSPFTDAVVPVPSATSGDQGIGGGLDGDSGPNGITASPWTNPVCPTPSGTVESGPFGNPSRFSTVDGSTHQGMSEQATIAEYKRTIDRK